MPGEVLHAYGAPCLERYAYSHGLRFHVLNAMSSITSTSYYHDESGCLYGHSYSWILLRVRARFQDQGYGAGFH